jgi:hypothetical protein
MGAPTIAPTAIRKESGMKYEFGSREWFAALQAIQCEKARALADPAFSYSVCEVMTGVPAHLAFLPGGKAAWCATIRGSDVTFELEERDDVNFKAVMDYAGVLPLTRFDTQGRADLNAELWAMSAALVASGKMKLIGDGPPGPFAAAHDAIVKLTA